MKSYVGVGSNLGDRRAHIESAAQALKALPDVLHLSSSPVFETPALVPAGAPVDWQLPFLNAVFAVEWSGTAEDLFRALKLIETQGGRQAAERWAPRAVDLDLLLFGEQVLERPHLCIPHKEMSTRSFVLDPLSHLAGSFSLPPYMKTTVLAQARSLRSHAPVWMGIANFTPDSFSDGGLCSTPEIWQTRLTGWIDAGVQILDLGAESTRPGAAPVNPEEEWARLQPVLSWLQTKNSKRILRPLVSVDTRHVTTAERAIEMGIDIINDVSGAQDPAMIKALGKSACQYIVMHSLSVPADPQQVLNLEQDPVETVKAWCYQKIKQLEEQGIHRDRLILDPGIGFGKTPRQSLTLLRRAHEFLDLPVRILIGHSRKSFMNLWGERKVFERDPESMGVSLQMASRGVEIVRVHEPLLHMRAYRAFQETAI